MNDEIITRLFELGDEKYKNFHKKLIPTVPESQIIGVRTPLLRTYARSIFGTDNAKVFMDTLPHKYYEENNLHAFLIEQIKDFNEALLQTEKFLPYMNNWATCDSFKPKVFAKNRDALLPYAKKWLKDERPYIKRYAIGIFMSLFLDDGYDATFSNDIAKITTDEYYVNMMVAWYFATAIAKQWDDAIAFLERKRLPTWTHNKTIQKALESFRIPDERKTYLRSLKSK